MKNIKQRLQDLPLARKMSLLFLGTAVFPILILSILAAGQLFKNNNDSMLVASRKNFEQAQSYLDYRFYRAYRTAVMISVDADVREICSGNPEGLDVNTRNLMTKKLVRYLDPIAANQDIKDVMFYVDESLLYVSDAGKVRSTQQILNQEWIRGAIGDGRGLRWTGELCRLETLKREEYLTAFRPITSVNDFLLNMAYLRLDIAKKDLDNALNRCVAVEGQLVYLVGNNQELMCCNDEELYRKLEQSYETADALWHETEALNEEVFIGRHRYYASCEFIESANCYLVSLIPKASINQGAVKVLFPIALAMTAVFCAAYLIFALLGRSIVRRISVLKGNMAKVEEGKMELLPVDAGDEIGNVTDGYNHMIERLKELLEEQFNMGQKITRVELKALQSQINPHFLYNTLDMIQWMAREGEVDEVQNMAGSLSNYYRLVLSKGADIVPLSTELEMCRSYAMLQRKRFEDTIELKMEIQEETLDCMIPKITLQPLVENAIYHGIREKESKRGIISITAYLEEALLHITVADDGVGMVMGITPGNAVGGSRINKSTGSQYGIKNIEQRLCLYYGIEGAMVFRSFPGIGTTVEICVPVKKENEK